MGPHMRASREELGERRASMLNENSERRSRRGLSRPRPLKSPFGAIVSCSFAIAS